MSTGCSQLWLVLPAPPAVGGSPLLLQLLPHPPLALLGSPPLPPPPAPQPPAIHGQGELEAAEPEGAEVAAAASYERCSVLWREQKDTDRQREDGWRLRGEQGCRTWCTIQDTRPPKVIDIKNRPLPDSGFFNLNRSNQDRQSVLFEQQSLRKMVNK
uniref:Uncharacterized protein n=1 Tax=Sphaerodactylus townsendi TaxID=933632 RepID=A0ACB8EVJ9_9SAUR